MFQRESPGFDAFVGNPPFAGKNTLSAGSPDGYLDWLKALHEESHGNADLVAHFFRRAFGLLRRDGCFGLIATNTIGQGDTRATGLRWICTHDGTVYAATKRYKWPGQAAVVVSVIWTAKGQLPGPLDLDGRPVPFISAYLFHAGGHDNPAVLQANMGRSFIGSYVLGMGFTFDDTDAKGVANPLNEMHRLIANDPRNAERIFPYIGGEEVNDSPTHAHRRYVINFLDFPLCRANLGGSWTTAENRQREQWLREFVVPLDYPAPVVSDWPELLRIVEERVKPERLKQASIVNPARWWMFARSAADLYAASEGLSKLLVRSRIGNAFAFTFLPARVVMNEKTVVFPFDSYAPFSMLQSRVHEIWAVFFSSTLKDDLQYTPTQCFETFPFPAEWETNAALEAAGREYYEFRAALMVRNNEGLTKTYNRFHDPQERSQDIQTLRDLHARMDAAVLAAYSWLGEDGETLRPGDGETGPPLPLRCEFLLDYADEEDDETVGLGDYATGASSPSPSSAQSQSPQVSKSQRRRKRPWRYRWPDETRDEVLARLLKLNAERAKEEQLAGMAAAGARPKRRKGGKSKPASSAAPAQGELLPPPQTDLFSR